MIYFYFIRKTNYATFCNNGTGYYYRFASDDVAMPDLGTKKYFEDFDFFLQSAREVNFEIPINRDDRHIDDYMDFFLNNIENFEDTDLSNYVVVIKDTEKPNPFFAGILDYKVQYKDDVMSFTAYDFSILFNKYGDAEFDFSDPIAGVCTNNANKTVEFTEVEGSGNLLSDYKVNELVIIYNVEEDLTAFVKILEINGSTFTFDDYAWVYNDPYQMKKTTKLRINNMFEPKLTEWKNTRNWLTNIVEEMSLWYFGDGSVQGYTDYVEKLDIERSEALIVKDAWFYGTSAFVTAFCYEKNGEYFYAFKWYFNDTFSDNDYNYRVYSIDRFGSTTLLTDPDLRATSWANLETLVIASGFKFSGSNPIMDSDGNIYRADTVSDTDPEYGFVKSFCLYRTASAFLITAPYKKEFLKTSDILKFLLFANNLTAYTDYNTIYFKNKQEQNGDYDNIDLDYATDTSPSVFVMDKYSGDAFGVLNDEEKDAVGDAIINYYNDFISKTKFEFEFGYLDDTGIIDVGKVVFDGKKYIFITEVEENLDDNFKNVRGFNVDSANYNTKFNYKLNFILGG